MEGEARGWGRGIRGLGTGVTLRKVEVEGQARRVGLGFNRIGK